jgi:hypothetical protein
MPPILPAQFDVFAGEVVPMNGAACFGPSTQRRCCVTIMASGGLPVYSTTQLGSSEPLAAAAGV